MVFTKKIDHEVYDKDIDEYRNNKSIQVVEFSDLISDLEENMRALSYFSWN